MRQISINYKRFLLFSFFLMVFSGNAQIIPSTTSDRTADKKIMIEEIWNESNWVNFTKTFTTFDSITGYYEEIIQKWNGSTWSNDTKNVKFYDKLHYNTGNVSYKWSNGLWTLMFGKRTLVDTILNNGNRLVLYDLTWDPNLKIWIADDSVFYDSKSRISKRVSNYYQLSSNTKDTIKIISLNENIYQNDNIWIEVQTIWRSDSKQVEKERYRYRKTDNNLIVSFMVDYWDERSNRWIPNTARLYRITDDTSLSYDSLEELINNKYVPVYVSKEYRDKSGNLMLEKISEKNFNEETGKWSGNTYKWERYHTMQSNQCNVAESTFVLDQAGKNWILTSYENQLCNYPFYGSYSESGSYEESFKMWEYDRTFDTLMPCGLLLSGENYCDFEKKQWLPLTNFSYTQTGDSVSIIKSYFNVDNRNWNNDSLFTVRLNSKGQIISRINHVWTQNGLFSGKWSKVNKISYLQN